MSSSSTMISSSHGWDQHHSLSSIITSSTPLSPPFLSTAPSSPSSSSSAMTDPASQLATPELQINKISLQLVANLDKATSSSSDAKGAHNASSLSTGSDFEFHSSYLPEINEDPPVSPKLIRPSTAANYWGGLSNNGRLEMIIPQQAQSNPLLSSPPYTSPVIKQISAPSSPSVRHLKADDYKDYFLSSSAPQTLNNSQQMPKQRPRQDNTSLRAINSDDQRRRKSSMLDRRALELSPLVMQKLDVDLAGGLEHNYIVSPSSSSSSSTRSSSSSTSSSSNGSSPADINEEFDEHKYTTSMDPAAAATISTNYNKKHRSRDSNKKCTFKGFLGWTVNPSSIRAADPQHECHSCKYESTIFESPRRQSTSNSISSPKPHSLLYGLRKTAPNSPAAASPLRSPAAAAVTPPTLAHGHPSPTRSPPRPPMSPHALHYKQQKARSDELRRKTFLPYRQSLLGCLGGATMYHSRGLQQVW